MKDMKYANYYTVAQNGMASAYTGYMYKFVAIVFLIVYEYEPPRLKIGYFNLVCQLFLIFFT